MKDKAVEEGMNSLPEGVLKKQSLIRKALQITSKKAREEVIDEVLIILEENGYYHKEVVKLKDRIKTQKD